MLKTRLITDGYLQAPRTLTKMAAITLTQNGCHKRIDFKASHSLIGKMPMII